MRGLLSHWAIWCGRRVEIDLPRNRRQYDTHTNDRRQCLSGRLLSPTLFPLIFYGYFTLPLLVGVFYEVQNRHRQYQSTLLVNTSVAFILLHTKPSRALYIQITPPSILDYKTTLTYSFPRLAFFSQKKIRINLSPSKESRAYHHQLIASIFRLYLKNIEPIAGDKPYIL